MSGVALNPVPLHGFSPARRRVAAASLASAVHVLILAALYEMTSPAVDLPLSERRPQLQATAWLLDYTFQEDTAYRASEPETPPPPAALIESVDLPELPALAVSAFEPAEIASTDADAETLRQLQGSYSQQLRARIDRVLRDEWPAHDAWTRCVARVIQDDAGRVLDVDLAECPLVDEDRARLENVVRAASPLPIPPDGLAMGRYLTLDLSAL